jgi:hypothetical protein
MNSLLLLIIMLLSFSLIYVLLNKKIDSALSSQPKSINVTKSSISSNEDKIETKKEEIIKPKKEEINTSKIEKIVYVPPKQSCNYTQPQIQQYPQYPVQQQYYPQSLLYPRNVYLDYVFNGYQPSHGYTWDPYYGWMGKNKKGHEDKIINTINNNISVPSIPTYSPK